MSLSNKILVCYLFTKFDDLNDFNNFIESYKSLNSGHDHTLIICLKLINQDQKKNILKILNQNSIIFTLFDDLSPKNDFDFGSYYRVAKEYDDKLIFFLNASSKPTINNWLKLLLNNYEKKCFLGTTASYESHVSSIKFKRYYKFFSYILRKLINLIFFKKFPNPHIRTTGFLLDSKDYINFYKNKDCQKKFDAWKIESGRNSITNFFLKKNFLIKLVNSDGKSYDIDNWSNAGTYAYKKKPKNIISDKHTRKYDLLTNNDKVSFQKKVWGSNSRS